MKTRNALLTGGYALVLTVFFLGFLDREPYDDSYFFKRVALNLLDHGVLAWNVADGPVYGSTSQVFQLVMVGLTGLTRTYTFLATRVFLAVCLFSTFLCLLRLTRARDGGFSAVLAGCAPVVLYTVPSGMETALALFALAALLFVLLDERPVRASFISAPLLAATVWLTRPDALLLALALLVGVRYLGERRLPVRELLVLFGLVFASLVVCKLYYGTALPLPFYAKQRLFSPYDDHFLAISLPLTRVRSANFAFVAVPLVIAGALRRDRLNALLLGSSALFVAYHYATTVEIMGMLGRFYAPALPLLVVAAARGLATNSAAAGSKLRAIVCALALCGLAVLVLGAAGGERARLGHYVCIGVAGVVLVSAAGSGRLFGGGPFLVLAAIVIVGAASPAVWSPTFRSDDAYLTLHTQKFTVYRGLDTLRRCFGDGIHVYHSEVGVPGLRFQRGTVGDLAGLLSPEWLFRTRSFDAQCLAQRPEGIFLPHKNYRTLNAEIAKSRCLAGYVRVVAESSSPLYVRADLAPAFEACRHAEAAP